MAAKKTKSKTASLKPNALEFCREYLRKSPDAPFATIRDAAAKKNLVLYPISYGRAQALEGIVKSKPYGSKKKAEAGAVKRGPGRPKGSKNKKRGPGRPKGSKNKRGPGRPPQARAGLDSIETLVSTLKTLQSERDDAIRTLDRIRSLLAN